MKRLLPLVLLCLMMLTSCDSVVSNTEDLLHPPTLNRQQAEIYAALETSLNISDIVYKYPQRGEYRSPVVIYDINGDGRDEAVVFYSFRGDLSNTRAKILVQNADLTWAPLHDISVASDTVDFVEFAHLLSTGSYCMIVGWRTASAQGGSAESALGIYSLVDDLFTTEVAAQSYIDYIIEDFERDGLDEIVTIEQNNGGELRISLLRSTGRHISVSASLPLCYNADSLLQSATGPLWDKSGAVYIDEVLIGETSVATEVVRVGDGQLEILAGGNQMSSVDDIVPAWENYTYTFRDLRLVSRDYDEDGRVEVPILKALPGTVVENEQEPLWLTEFMELTEDGFRIKSQAVINEREGYLVFFPEKWMTEEPRESLVTVVRFDDLDEWRFYLVNPETGEPATELLRIQAVAGNAQQPSAGGNYVDLGSSGSRRFTGYIPLTAEDAPSITVEELQEMFHLMN